LHVWEERLNFISLWDEWVYKVLGGRNMECSIQGSVHGKIVWPVGWYKEFMAKGLLIWYVRALINTSKEWDGSKKTC